MVLSFLIDQAKHSKTALSAPKATAAPLNKKAPAPLNSKKLGKTTAKR
jgi:hypothetical protein